MTHLTKYQTSEPNRPQTRVAVQQLRYASNSILHVGLMVLSIVLLCLSITSTALAQHSMDPTLKELTNEAMMDMNQDNFEDALEKLIKVQASAPAACIHHLMGVCYFKLGNLVAAQIHLEQAVEDLIEEEEDQWDPSLEKAPIHALNYMGKTFYERGDFGNAMEYFSRFLVSLYMFEDSDTLLIDWTEELIAQFEALQPTTHSQAFKST
jgi:tetratricopeptide (TPR) repeat protein